jgi:hypothetical protein
VLECVTLLASLEHGRDGEHAALVDVVPVQRRFTVAGISGDDLVLLPAGSLIAAATPAPGTPPSLTPSESSHA